MKPTKYCDGVLASPPWQLTPPPHSQPTSTVNVAAILEKFRRNDGFGLVALIGVRDLIVVDTPDALLVAARDRAQEVGDIVKTLEQRNRHDLL